MPLKQLLALIAPDECLGCNKEGSIWCGACLQAFELVSADTALPQLAGLTAPARYGGVVKELVHGLKFERRQSAARPLAWLIARGLPSGRFDLVTAVPTPPARLRERGYNQAEQIARELARQLSLPYQPLLVRLNSSTQVGASRQQRIQQASSGFEAICSVKGRILLVDDVVTTGATLAACAMALTTAGADSVWGAVAAQH